MTASINTERNEDLARRLAARTGQAPEDAVEQALTEKLSRVESEPPKNRKKASAEELMAMAKEISAMMSPEWKTWDYDADLYDEETGLPK